MPEGVNMALSNAGAYRPDNRNFTNFSDRRHKALRVVKLLTVTLTSIR
jgi:hypothetical protein